MWGWFVLWGLLGVGSLQAQAPPVEQRQFDQQRLQDYRNQEDFQYQRATPAPARRQIRKDQPRRRGRRSSGFTPDSSRGDMSGGAKIILWIVLGVIAGWIILQLTQVRLRKALRNASDEALPDLDDKAEKTEDPRTMRFDELLEKAIREKRFRYAVRLLYLRSLRQLSEAGRIQWKQDKTNYDYLRELDDQALRGVFGDLTYIFEYIWYGEFPIDQSHFETARSSFSRLDHQLKSSSTGHA